jgi:hypothetical protein
MLPMLADTDPRSEEYGRLLCHIGDLNYRLTVLDGTIECPAVVAHPIPKTPTETKESTPAEERPVVDTDDIKGDTEYINPEDLRAALAVAKKKGVIISELISSLGAPNFTGLKDDQNKLRQLKTLVENALKEIA